MLKNKDLSLDEKFKLCKTHNDKNVSQRKIKLCALKSQSCIKTYHPLKNRKVKLHRLKFVHDDELGTFFSQDIKYREFLSKRFKVNVGKNQQFWATEEKVVDWLRSIGIHIRRIPNGMYIIDNKAYNINSMILFANKRCTELGLPPFYIDGLTEF
ncbi:MAG: hypothetical protein K6C34_04195 [Alphaproteobacteria bacterium]|nr:hypothetical protein [Alphaproteobacteria bacterium]